MLCLGFAFTMVENISLFNAFNFTCITAMSIGYSDIVPAASLGKLIAIAIGFLGMISTGLLVALALMAAKLSYENELEKQYR